MKKNIYVVYDNIAKDTVGVIMTFSHDAPAVRVFTDGLADPTTLGRHPADFDLLLVGSIDPENHHNGDGLVYGLDKPIQILSGSAWLASQQPREK